MIGLLISVVVLKALALMGALYVVGWYRGRSQLPLWPGRRATPRSSAPSRPTPGTAPVAGGSTPLLLPSRDVVLGRLAQLYPQLSERDRGLVADEALQKLGALGAGMRARQRQ